MAELTKADLSRSPAEISFDALSSATKLLGAQDAFAEDKKRDNDLIKGLLPDLRRQVAESSEPVALAARFAIAGNIIDLGLVSGVDAKAEIERALERRLAIDDSTAFHEAVRSAKSVFYVLDNAGEVVLDRLLIEQFKRKQVTCLVRSGPILNDVTTEDALDVGLGSLCEIRDPGRPMLGLVLNLADPDIQERFEKADLVIAKGQANLETLFDVDREVFFFLRAKCPVVAKALGVLEGDAVLMRYVGGRAS
jgi:hypothetical protein